MEQAQTLKGDQLLRFKPEAQRGTSIDQFLEKHYGKAGSEEREEMELLCKLEELGGLVRVVREKAGLSQGDLGKKMGVKKAQVSRLEKSRGNISLSTLIRLLNALQTEAWLQIILPENISISLPLA